jgi:hypothetical protein
MPMNPRLMRPERSADFDPRSFGTLGLWLDASDSSSVTLNDGNVAVLRDKSGNGIHFAQQIAAYQPAYVTAEQNGRNLIRVPSALDGGAFPLINNNVPVGAFGSQGMTLFFAGRPHPNTRVVRTFYSAVSGANRVQLYHPYRTGPLAPARTVVYYNSSADTLIDYTWPAGGDETLPHIVCYHLRSGDTRDLEVNGTGLVSVAVNQQTLSGTQAIGLLNNIVNNSTQYRGDFYELLIFATPLPAAARSAVAICLKAKWGVP